MKYICTECTGNTGEEHTFYLDEEPKACPYHGCGERHIETIETYLRERIEDLEWEVDRYEERYETKKKEYKGAEERIEELEEALESDAVKIGNARLNDPEE